MKHELLILAGALFAGAGLGALYFKSLWFTVDRLSSVERPARWMLTSLFLRFAVLISGLYGILHFAGADALIAATVGVVLGRTGCLHYTHNSIRKREALL